MLGHSVEGENDDTMQIDICGFKLEPKTPSKTKITFAIQFDPKASLLPSAIVSWFASNIGEKLHAKLSYYPTRLAGTEYERRTFMGKRSEFYKEVRKVFSSVKF